MLTRISCANLIYIVAFWIWKPAGHCDRQKTIPASYTKSCRTVTDDRRLFHALRVWYFYQKGKSDDHYVSKEHGRVKPRENQDMAEVEREIRRFSESFLFLHVIFIFPPNVNVSPIETVAISQFFRSFSKTYASYNIRTDWQKNMHFFFRFL